MKKNRPQAIALKSAICIPIHRTRRAFPFQMVVEVGLHARWIRRFR